MSNFVKIIAISAERKDKNNRAFKSIVIESPATREVVDKSTGEIMLVTARPKRTTINAYERSYLDDAPHYLYDKEIGDNVFGTIVTKNVTPYTIPFKDGDRMVDRYTTFVEAAEDDEDFESMVVSTFKQAGHDVASPKLGFSVLDQEVKEPVTVEASEEAEEAEESEDAPAQFSVVGDDDAEDIEDEF